MINTKHEETLEGNDLQCPYCLNWISDSWELVKEDDRVEIDCDCGKKFWGSEQVIRNFKGEADCELNNEEHLFEKNHTGHWNCKICGLFQSDETFKQKQKEVKQK